MRRILFALAVLASGCVSDPVKRDVTNNPDVGVSTLFVHEGYKVMRFNDGGNFHYYVVPARPGDLITTLSLECSGSGRHRSCHPESVITVLRETP